MEKGLIQDKILRKLMSMKPAKLGNSHTEEKNLEKGLPPHLRGSKIMDKAIKELYQMGIFDKIKENWRVACFLESTKERRNL